MLREKLEDLDYPNKKLFEDMGSGFKLAGWMRDAKVLIASLELQRLALKPYSSHQLGFSTLRLERLWNRRIPNFMQQLGKITSLKKSVDGFGQGEEVRVIDNFKQCGPNDACFLRVSSALFFILPVELNSCLEE